MKVTMDRTGCLEIRPDSPVEDYALQKLTAEWIEHKIALRIVIHHDGGGEKTFEFVQPVIRA